MLSKLKYKLFGLSFGVLFSVVHFSEISHAQYVFGPVASGMGGASRVGVEDGEQILHNPASIVHSSKAASSIFYGDGYHAKDEHDRWMGAMITDNTEDLFASGGFIFVDRRQTFANFNSRDEKYYQFTIGKFIHSQIALGISPHYRDIKVEGDKSYDLWNGDVGMHYNPLPDWAFALVFYNVGPDQSSTPRQLKDLDKISFGAQWIFLENFQLRADVSQIQDFNEDDSMHLQTGFESKASKFFNIRVGYQRDSFNDVTKWSTGFSFDGPRIKIDYFYEKNFNDSRGALHGVDMRLPFW